MPLGRSPSTRRATRNTRDARLLDRLVPPTALSWGRLTHETDEWLADAVRWQLANIPATLTRPCPAFSRLDQLMAAGGKNEPDAWVPGQIGTWWRA